MRILLALIAGGLFGAGLHLSGIDDRPFLGQRNLSAEEDEITHLETVPVRQVNRPVPVPAGPGGFAMQGSMTCWSSRSRATGL